MAKKKLSVEYNTWEIQKNIYKMKLLKGSIIFFIFAFFIDIVINIYITKKYGLFISYRVVLYIIILEILLFIGLFIHYHVKKIYSVRNYDQEGSSIIKDLNAYQFESDYDRDDISTYQNLTTFDVTRDDNEFRGIPVGTIAADNEQGYQYVISHKTEDHAEIKGSTGSGKTETVVLPYIDILSLPSTKCIQESMLITDPKGQIYKKMYKLLKSRGYEIIVQNTLDTVQSNRINSLSYIYQISKKIDNLLNGGSWDNLNTEEKIEYANLNSLKNKQIGFTAKLFTDDPEAKDKVWQEAAYSTLTGFIHFTIHFLTLESRVKNNVMVDYKKEIKDGINKLKSKLESINLEDTEAYIAEMEKINSKINNIQELINVDYGKEDLNFTSMTIRMNQLLGIKTKRDSSNMLDDLMNMLDSFHPARLANSPNNAASGNTKGSVLLTLLNNLGIFLSDESIAAMTSGNDIEFMDLDKGKPKAIFCITPDDDKSRHKITSIFIENVYSALREISRGYVSGELNRRFNIVGEEIANVCEVLYFPEKLSVARGSNIRFALFLQADDQLDVKYGEKIAKIIRKNCRLKMLILSNDVDEINNFIKGAGNTTVETESVTYNESKATPMSRQVNMKEQSVLRFNEVKEVQFTNVFVDLVRYPSIRGTLPPTFKIEHLKNIVPLEKIVVEKPCLVNIKELQILNAFEDNNFLYDLTQKEILDEETGEIYDNEYYNDFEGLYKNKLVNELKVLLS